MTGDVRRIYGNRVSMFGLARPVAGSPGVTPISSGSLYGGNRGLYGGNR